MASSQAEAAEAAKEAEEAEYAQWSGLIEVEGGGEGAAEAEAERQGMLTDFVDYIKRKKVRRCAPPDSLQHCVVRACAR